jgi:hypothetical protein
MKFNVSVEAGTRNLTTWVKLLGFLSLPQFMQLVFLGPFQSSIQLLSMVIKVAGKRIIQETVHYSLHVFLQEHSIPRCLCKKIIRLITSITFQYQPRNKLSWITITVVFFRPSKPRYCAVGHIPSKLFHHSLTTLPLYAIVKVHSDFERVIHKKKEKHYDVVCKMLRLTVHRSPVSIGERVCINQCLVRTEVRGSTVLQEQFAVPQMRRKERHNKHRVAKEDRKKRKKRHDTVSGLHWP